MTPKELEEIKHNCVTFPSNYFYVIGREMKYREENYYFPKVTRQVWGRGRADTQHSKIGGYVLNIYHYGGFKL